MVFQAFAFKGKEPEASGQAGRGKNQNKTRGGKKKRDSSLWRAEMHRLKTESSEPRTTGPEKRSIIGEKRSAIWAEGTPESSIRGRFCRRIQVKERERRGQSTERARSNARLAEMLEGTGGVVTHLLPPVLVGSRMPTYKRGRGQKFFLVRQ